MRFRTGAAVVLGALSLAIPTVSRAEDVAAGKALFDRGLADMVAGHYDSGCPAIAESYTLDPRPGTLFTRAECEAKRGRIATAVELYDDYLSQYARLSREKQEQQGHRRTIALEQRATLAPQVPQLTLLLVPDTAPGTRVTRDGSEVAPAAIGLALPVDPGEHVLSVQAPGGPALEIRVRVGVAEKKLLTLPRPPTAPPLSTRRVGAVVAGSVGIAGLLVGVVTGGLTLARKGVVDAHCNYPGDLYGCDATGLAATSAAKSLAGASTVAFVVGVAGLAGGAALFFTEPRNTTRGLQALHAGMLTAGRDATTFGLRGAW